MQESIHPHVIEWRVPELIAPEEEFETLAEDPTIRSLEACAGELATMLGKLVRIEAAAFRTESVPEHYRQLVLEIVLELATNALLHGIETPPRRMARGKPAEAVLRVAAWRADSETGVSAFHLSFSDDGNGLDFDGIRARAVALGLADAPAAASLRNEHVALFLFRPGFSSSDAPANGSWIVSGLESVKRHVVDEFGGDLDVASSPGRSVLFNIVLPV